MAEKLRFIVELDNGKLVAKTEDTKKKIDSIGDTAEKTGKKFSKFKTAATLAAGSVTAIFTKIAISSVKLAAKFEKTSVAFETMLGGGKDGKKAADQLLKDIQKFASKTPLSFDDLTTGSKRLLAFGTGVQDLIPTMQMLGDASQGNADTLDRLTLAYGKVQSRGKASMEELNQISEAGIPIIQELADNYGVSKEELFEMVSAGKVGFTDLQQVFKDMTGEGGQFNGMMERMSSTLEGKWSTLKDKITILMTEAGEKALKPFKELLDVVTESESVIPSLINAIGSALGFFANVIARVVSGIDLLISKAKFEDVSKEIEEQQRIRLIYETKYNEAKKKGDKEAMSIYTELLKATYEEEKRLKLGQNNYEIKLTKERLKNKQEELAATSSMIRRNEIGDEDFLEKMEKGRLKRLEKNHANELKEIEEYGKELKKLAEERAKIQAEYISSDVAVVKPPGGVKGGKGGKGKGLGMQVLGGEFIEGSSPIDSKGGKFDFNEYLRYQDSVLGASMDLVGTLNNLSEQYYANEMTRVDQLLEKKLNATQLWYEQERDILLNSQMDHEARELALSVLEAEKEKRDRAAKEKAEKRKRKLQNEAFKREQASGIANVWINTGVAIMKAFAQLGPIIGGVMTPLILGNAGAQTALISGQKPPALATGTTDVPTDMLAQIHKGEGVIPKTFMSGIRDGELTLGSANNSGTIINQYIEGSVTTENELFNRIDELRNERAQTLGQKNYGV